MIQQINDLSFEFVPLNPIKSVNIGGTSCWKGIPAAYYSVRLLQVDDEDFRFEGGPGTGSKATGWLEMNDGKGNMALTLKDFWQ